jgi:hypothetical protein
VLPLSEKITARMGESGHKKDKNIGLIQKKNQARRS